LVYTPCGHQQVHGPGRCSYVQPLPSRGCCVLCTDRATAVPWLSARLLLPDTQVRTSHAPQAQVSSSAPCCRPFRTHTRMCMRVHACAHTHTHSLATHTHTHTHTLATHTHTHTRTRTHLHASTILAGTREPQGPLLPSRIIYVGGLADGTTHTEVAEALSAYKVEYVFRRRCAAFDLPYFQST
jgi:hypothetical protein